MADGAADIPQATEARYQFMNTQDPMTQLDARAYLDRIRIPVSTGAVSLKPSAATLQALHEAHMLAIPFENLSIHYGQPIILEAGSLFDKVVRRRRGGFCYELNGLFAWLLRTLDYEVTLLSAGVAQASGGFTPDYDHLTLLIHDVDGSDWLADVGFGNSFRRPLRFQPDIEQDGGDGHRYRLKASETQGDAASGGAQPDIWVMQRLGESGWQAQYRFTLEPHNLGDFNERCVFQQTSPESHFTQRRLCSMALPAGRITLSDLRLIETTSGARQERLLASEEEYRAVLAERFGVVI